MFIVSMILGYCDVADKMTARKELSKTAPDTELQAFRSHLLVEAERMVLEDFPQRAVDFNRLLQSERYGWKRLPEIIPDEQLIVPAPVDGLNGKDHDEEQPLPKKRKLEAGTPVYGFAGGGCIPSNEKLLDLMEEIRPMIRLAVESMNTVKMWITLLIPRIEDGNNFGVSIQEETLSEVRNVEGEAASYLDELSRYFITRAKLLTKVAKYPHVQDYRRAILDMDEKQFVNIRLVLTEMRNHFTTLHDVITKNLEKIKKPRTNNHDSMY